MHAPVFATFSLAPSFFRSVPHTRLGECDNCKSIDGWVRSAMRETRISIVQKRSTRCSMNRMRNRGVLVCATLILGISNSYAAVERPRPAAPPREVTITLVGRAGDLGTELVNFGLPLPPGFLN